MQKIKTDKIVKVKYFLYYLNHLRSTMLKISPSGNQIKNKN